MINERLKYFQVLGINPTDNVEAIKKAYRKMAFKHHPDKNPSADAHVKFIQITEAYEVLTGQRKIGVTRKPPADAKVRPRTEEESFAEKVHFAKERYRRQQEEEARKDALYFRMITSGWKWRFFRVGAWYAAILSFCLIFDYFATGSTETIAPSTFAPHNKTISANGEHFLVENYDYWDSDYFGQVRGNRSLLFNDLKSISVVLDPPDMTIRRHSDKMKQYQDFDGFEMYTVMSFGSMYGSFPIVHLFLLVPLALVKWKRPILRFSIWRLVSIYVFFPLALFLTFSNDRIFHLLGLM